VTTINLHIERLVLEGLPLAAHEGPLVGEAVTAELTRLLGTGGQLAVGHAAPLVRVPPIQVGGGPRRLGAGIGQVVFEGIRR
jgi:hypothetical protein